MTLLDRSSRAQLHQISMVGDFPMFWSQSKGDGPMCSPLPSMTCVELSTLIISYATLRGMNKLDSTKKLVSELLKRERRQQVSELKWFKSIFVN